MTFEEYKVTWAQVPTASNRQECTFVFAQNKEQAEELVRDHIARKRGYARIGILHTDKVVTTYPGRVIGP